MSATCVTFIELSPFRRRQSQFLETTPPDDVCETYHTPEKRLQLIALLLQKISTRAHILKDVCDVKKGPHNTVCDPFRARISISHRVACHPTTHRRDDELRSHEGSYGSQQTNTICSHKHMVALRKSATEKPSADKSQGPRIFRSVALQPF